MMTDPRDTAGPPAPAEAAYPDHVFDVQEFSITFLQVSSEPEWQLARHIRFALYARQCLKRREHRSARDYAHKARACWRAYLSHKEYGA